MSAGDVNMPNFKKTSRFDDGDNPPEVEYPDWTKESTKVMTVLLDGLPADYVLERLKKTRHIVEVLLGGLKADECGKLIVRVRK